MKKIFLLSVVLILGIFSVKGEDPNPLADPSAVIQEGEVRFTILTPRVIRLEWDAAKQFTDNRSFVVVNRNLPVPAFTRSVKGGKLMIKTAELELTYQLNSGKFTKDNLQIRYLNKKNPLVWNPGMQQKQNLKGTARTLDRMDGTTWIRGDEPQHQLELEDGILSRDGWTLLDDSQSLLFDNADVAWVKERDNNDLQDLYFMAYGNDYKTAIKDFTLFAGKTPLPPRFVFGYWWSRYWAYSDNELRDVAANFKQYNIPLDVLVVDMDWHETDSLFARKDQYDQKKHWTGWTWEKRLFPDPKQFFDWTKTQHLKTTLNLHPASGMPPFESQYKDFARAMNFDTSNNDYIPWQGSNKKFMETLFDVVLHPIEKQGLDFWWLDWQQWVFDKDLEKLNNTWWLNYTFFTDMQRNSEKRPVIYHRWGGLGNHRYQIGFSGDAYITWNTLEYQPYFTNTASNVLYGYWSHDIGGHKFIEDGKTYEFEPEMYARWVQYGALSPILRTHSNKDPLLAKEIWKYRGEYFNALYNAVRLRYQLVPYIYTMARETFETGLSLCRPMYYDYAANEQAYSYSRQYLFGDNILVAPIGAPMQDNLSKVKVWLPEGNDWYEWHTGTLLKGGQEVEREFPIEEYPVYIKSGSVIPMYDNEVTNLDKNPDKQIIAIFPGGDGRFFIYEDAGNDQKYETEFATTQVISTLDKANRRHSVTIYPREGKYAGIEATKNQVVKLYGVEMPVSVTVNGVNKNYTVIPNETDWSYYGREFAVSIPLIGADCAAKYEVVVEYNKTQQADVNDGLIRQMKVLQKAIEARKFKYAGGYVVPEITGFCAETNLKVAYDPDNFYQYINYFKANHEKAYEITKLTK
ncbi:MAG: glycoside hydrolase family 31 protein [Candidatus Symbiothrix sp.]|jgi:alpha-glucosidase (family GH31 glycosyl hydrolase)|nr:glycoside hydrolase family 31 protein [Candidatus Symbiothrix sp.]